MTCENIEWVSPVICWFGDNLDANKCIIRPAVEFKEKGLKYSEEWKVGKYDRNTAYEGSSGRTPKSVVLLLENPYNISLWGIV
jgi:hypothetical protein